MLYFLKKKTLFDWASFSVINKQTANHNLGLPVVRGKWFQPKTCNERSCSTYEVLGDEYHFFLQCTKHQDLQLKFIARCYSKRPSMHKFVELMSSLRKVVIIKLAAFVHIELETENVYMYCSPSLARIILVVYVHTYVTHRPIVYAEWKNKHHQITWRW